MHIATSKGFDELAMLLLEEHSQLDRRDSAGYTPLDYLLKDTGVFETAGNTVDTALQDEADSIDSSSTDNESDSADSKSANSETNNNGPRPVDKEYRRKRMQIFAEFARRKPGYSDESGKSFLHRAVGHPDLDLRYIKTLLDEGYDLEKRDQDGRTPLHLAIMAGRTDRVLWLLGGNDRFRANHLARDSKQETCLMFAASVGSVQILKKLLQDVSSNSSARREQHESAEQASVPNERLPRADHGDRRCNPLDVNFSGQTALHIALSAGHSDAAVYLLSLDSIPRHRKDKQGNSLLISACMSGCSSQCIKSILQRWRRSIRDTDPLYSRSALSWACEKASNDVVETLISHRNTERLRKLMNRPEPRWQGYVPLHFAAERSESSILKTLLSVDGVEIDVSNSQKIKSLALALLAQRVTNVRLLLNHSQMDKTRVGWLYLLCQHKFYYMHGVVAELMDLVDPDHVGLNILSEIEKIGDQHDPAPCKAFIEWLFKHDLEHHLPLPFHSAARIGRLDLIERLHTSSAKTSCDLDQDKWSWAHCACVFSPATPTEMVERTYEQQVSPNYEPLEPEVPYELLLEPYASNIKVQPCGSSIQDSSRGKQGKERAGCCLASPSSTPPLIYD